MSREAIDRHNRQQRAYFESRFPHTMIPSATPYVRRHVDELLSGSGLAAGDAVLEVGCGMGHYTFELADRGLALEGLDLSPGLLDRLREHMGDNLVALHCADILDPPAGLLGRFDGVVGLFTLHHLHDLPRSIRSMTRLLRPGGRLAFVEPNPLNPLYYLQIAAIPGMSWRHERGITRMRPSIVLPALRAAGLSDVRLRRYGFLPPVLSNTRSGWAVEHVLEGIPPLRPVCAFQLFAGRLP